MPLKRCKAAIDARTSGQPKRDEANSKRTCPWRVRLNFLVLQFVLRDRRLQMPSEEHCRRWPPRRRFLGRDWPAWICLIAMESNSFSSFTVVGGFVSGSDRKGWWRFLFPPIRPSFAALVGSAWNVQSLLVTARTLQGLFALVLALELWFISSTLRISAFDDFIQSKVPSFNRKTALPLTMPLLLATILVESSQTMPCDIGRYDWSRDGPKACLAAISKRKQKIHPC